MSLESLKQLNEKNVELKDMAASSLLESSVRVEVEEKDRFPLSIISLSKFMSSIQKLTGSRIDESLARIITGNRIDVENTTVAEFDSQIPYRLRFSDGLFRTDKKPEPITVKSITIESGACRVIVSGTSEDAESVVSGVFNSLMQSAGYSKKYDESCAHAKSYATSSVVRMNFGISNALSSNLQEGLEKTVFSENPKYKKLGAMKLEEGDLSRFMVIAKMQELVLSLIKMDKASGATQECVLAIRPRTVDDVDAGDYVVSSQYDNKIHEELVQGLKQSLT